MPSRDPRVVIIGAGVAGITAGVVLEQAGFENFVIVEKGSDVGGVWHWNRYPGLTCDVPSQIYQFGFAPKPDWSQIWAEGSEIQRYHREAIETVGKRIAVIGSGSTGVQVVSALQPQAAALTQFARTPQWVLWAPMGLRQPRLVAKLLAAAPAAHQRLYSTLLWGSGILADIALKPTWRRRAAQQLARWSLTTQVRDRELRTALTPDYEPFCKRQVLSGTYHRAIGADNAALVTEPISEITETGLRTADGTHHDLDLIVFATGFHPHNYMRPMNLRGRDGLSIDEAWAKGPRAYRMTAIPGFPNLFTVLGPNSPTGSISLQYSAELTARYITQWLERFRDGEFETVEVTEEATVRFNDSVAEAMGPTVWNTGCNSWYFTEENTIDLWPFDRKTMTALLTAPDDRDFLIGHKDGNLR
ncbi:flavin-containing monooxygenase [Nocardia sp. NPDC058519]|uniref:flavin-containing monooxygenase n=1 Tax=Nocardia sp. NPDC058519 TaxID=3346535 RepID=UPI00364B31E2